MPQSSKLETTLSAPRASRSVRTGTVRRRSHAAHVVVTWTPANDGGSLTLEPTQVELEAELEASASPKWTCRQPSGSGWAEALASARCSEVLLTALSDDLPSKHLVFDLAGLLTLKLAATRPLIRVRFLPPPELAMRDLARYGMG